MPTPRAPQTLFFQKITVGPGQTYPVVISGNYCYVEGVMWNTTELSQSAINDSILTVKPDTTGAVSRLIASKREIQFPENFSNLQFTNSSAFATAVIWAWVGSGRVRSDAPTRRVNSSFSAFNTSGAVAYAVGDVVGNSPQPIQGICSPYNQRARIKSLTVQKTSATTANANFTLWLFSAKGTGSCVDNAAFAIGATPAGINPYEYLGQIQIPAFVTGGAGSTVAICSLAGLDVEIFTTPTDANGYAAGTIYGVLTANAAYVPTNGELFTFTLTAEWS